MLHFPHFPVTQGVWADKTLDRTLGSKDLRVVSEYQTAKDSIDKFCGLQWMPKSIGKHWNRRDLGTKYEPEPLVFCCAYNSVPWLHCNMLQIAFLKTDLFQKRQLLKICDRVPAGSSWPWDQKPWEKKMTKNSKNSEKQSRPWWLVTITTSLCQELAPLN